MSHFRRLLAKARQTRARSSGILLADDFADVVDAAFAQRLSVKRQRPGQQFIKHHSQRINISACVDVLSTHLGLLGTHILRRADKLALFGVEGPVRQRLRDGLGNPEINNLQDRLFTLHRDQNVGRLNVTVNDALLMGVLHAFTCLQKQLQTLLDAQLIPVAMLDDGNAFDVFHGEIRQTGVGRPGFEYGCDIRVFHQSQRLALRLEAGNHLLGIHAGLDDLQRDPASDGLVLLGQVNDGEAPLAEDAQQPVRADLPDRLGSGGAE